MMIDQDKSVFKTVFVWPEVLGGAWWQNPTPSKKRWIFEDGLGICLSSLWSWVVPAKIRTRRSH